MRSSLWMVLVSLALAPVACAPAPVTPSAMPACPSVSASPPASASAVAPASASASAAAPASTSAPAPAPDGPPPEPPAAFTHATDAARKAILAADYAAADRQLDAADAAAGGDPHLGFLATYYRAARFAYAGDFERAAAAFVARIPALAKHPETSDEFWAHNAMMMIREAQGDPAAALAENDQATLAAARGTWDPADRNKLAFDKDRWHRAYLTRMLAESRAGSVKQGLVAYAQAALDDYRSHGGGADAIAVLEAYFAALDGKREAALAAAKRVDPAKDDDLEDLYLVVIGLEAGGDHVAAEAVRRVMRQPGGVHLARAIMLRWLDLDAKGPKARGFSPLRATAR